MCMLAICVLCVIGANKLCVFGDWFVMYLLLFVCLLSIVFDVLCVYHGCWC